MAGQYLFFGNLLFEKGKKEREILSNVDSEGGEVSG
jgi:hypothetical protein